MGTLQPIGVFGSMALGSTLWGYVASVTSVSSALLVAGIGALLAIPITWRASLAHDAAMELSPSIHWPALPSSDTHFDEDQPVMIQITYAVPKENQSAFKQLMGQLQQSRQSHGAYEWALRHDVSDATFFVETWLESSWLHHLHHHERVTKTDHQLQMRIRRCLLLNTEPVVQHYTGDALVD